MTGLTLPARFTRAVVEAVSLRAKVWRLRLACGHEAIRHRQVEAPRDARCAVCARGSR